MSEANNGMYLGVSAPATLVHEGVGVRRAERACGTVGALLVAPRLALQVLKAHVGTCQPLLSCEEQNWKHAM